MKNKMRFQLVILFFIGFVHLGFNIPIGAGPEEYLAFYKQNIGNYSKTVVDGPIEFRLSYLPTELRVINKFYRNDSDEALLQEELSQKDDLFEFMLSINIPDNGNEEFLKYPNDQFTYEQRVEYYSFGLGKDIKVRMDSGLDQAVDGYTFERNFGISPTGTASVHVRVPKNTETISFTIDDKVYGSETNVFVFDLKSIKELPRLKKVTKWKIHTK